MDKVLVLDDSPARLEKFNDRLRNKVSLFFATNANDAIRLLQSIKFDDAVSNRIESNEWLESHIDRINYVRVKLMELQPELARSHNDTW